MASVTKLPPYPWIKAWTEWIDDPAVSRLSLQGVGAYTWLYLLAARSDAGGVLRNDLGCYTVKDIAWLLRIDEGILSAAIGELRDAGLVEEVNGAFMVTRFLDEQGPCSDKQRKDWRDAQKRHRENNAAQPIKADIPVTTTSTKNTLSKSVAAEIEQYNQQLKNRRQMDGLET